MKTLIRENNTLLERAGAEFSRCEKYRYRLWRIWDPTLPACAFIGLNPSTADENQLDPTLTRCRRFAEKWGYGGLQMLNLFAFRATQPKDMFACAKPVGGPRNDEAILEVASTAGVVVAAWGNHGSHLGRADQVRCLLPTFHHLRLTGKDMPEHPLYLPGHLNPLPWITAK